MAKKTEQKPSASPYKRESKLRFTPAQAKQEYEWALQRYECQKKFLEHVRIALNTKSPTRRKELYQEWRQKYGDDITRSYAKYAESVYAGGDTLLLDRFAEFTKKKPEPFPDYMIIGDDDDSGRLL